MKKMLFYGTTFLMLLSACSNEDSQSDNAAGNALTVTAINVNDEVKTRAGIETTLHSKTVGLYVAGTGYAPTTYSTCAITSAGAGGTVTSPVYLLGSAQVYGFYPTGTISPVAPTSASVLTGVTILATDAFGSTGQTDYMYATQDANVTKADPAVVLTFHHALSKLTFVVNSANYDGTGALTKVVLTDKATSNAFLYSAAAGTMSIAAGTFAGLTATSVLTYNGSATINKTVSTTGTTSVLAAPTTLPTTTTLALTIDGTAYTADITSSVTAWAAGKEYTYTVTVSNAALTITSISVADWTTGGTGTATM
jgi:hypothetical protein